VSLELGGLGITLVDTAGLRESLDPVEREGVRRARARAASADLVIAVLDATAPDEAAAGALLVANKCDLAPAPPGALAVSARTGEGLPALTAELLAQANRLTSGAETPVLNRARHVSALRDVNHALEAASTAPLPELRAEDLRLALRALGRITGEVDVETILDVVFGSFCIGK
jgi:tRNA modification GTPase